MRALADGLPVCRQLSILGRLRRTLPCPPSIVPTRAGPRPPSVLKSSTGCRRTTLTPKRACWAASLLDPNLCDDVATIVRPDDFYADANQKLYAHLLAMHDEGQRIDATLLLERLRTAGDLEAIGGTAYLAEVVHPCPYAANAAYYAEHRPRQGHAARA